jgi:tetratricopeptide (TPR) repeat protein
MFGNQKRRQHVTYKIEKKNSSLVRMNSQNPDALYLRARVFYSQGENQKTVAHCQEALRCDPDFSKARDLLKQARSIEKQKESGNNAFKSNQLEEAFDAYTAAMDIDPTNDHMNSRLYSNRAAVLQKVCYIYILYEPEGWITDYIFGYYSKRNSRKPYLIVINLFN